jgi:micrococcal nuclease
MESFVKFLFKIFNAATLLGYAIFFLPTVYASTITCKVVGIIDGDTIKCLSEDKELIKIRLASIDAPESKQPYGQISKQNLSRMIFGKMVQVIFSSQDKYSRTIGTIYYQNKDINLEQVNHGYAWVFREFSKNPIYYVAELNAKKHKLGLWQDKAPIYPSIWRKLHQ